jgi:hypothetical protein
MIEPKNNEHRKTAPTFTNLTEKTCTPFPIYSTGRQERDSNKRRLQVRSCDFESNTLTTRSQKPPNIACQIVALRENFVAKTCVLLAHGWRYISQSPYTTWPKARYQQILQTFIYYSCTITTLQSLTSLYNVTKQKISNMTNDRRKIQVWDFEGCSGRCQIFVRLVTVREQ